MGKVNSSWYVHHLLGTTHHPVWLPYTGNQPLGICLSSCLSFHQPREERWFKLFQSGSRVGKIMVL